MKPLLLYPVLQAIASALLFGASAPLLKILVGEVEPVILAAFLYLGCGLGAFLLQIYGGALRGKSSREAKLTRTDLPWLAGAIIAGGILGPITLLVGLSTTPAATASLLLNFESAATAVVAALLFREAIGRRVWWAIGLITLASIVLSFNMYGEGGFSIGALAVLGACFLWGLDNNFTRNISAKDPLAIVTIKGLAAGGFSLLLGLSLGIPLPSLRTMLLAMLVGWFCYGLSITLFVLAMRDLGAARTGTFFATAPFIGTLLSFLLLREQPSILFFVALPLMLAGALVLLKEDHAHEHEHALMEHDHRHTHPDGHHVHPHEGAVMLAVGAHAHAHMHETVLHAHGHMPDLHHRHSHKD